MMRRAEGKLSPTKFHNSVHNAASGYASIASGNCAPSTTLTGGAELVYSALVEAMCLLEAQERDVVLVLADEPLQPPFERADAESAVALALLLSPRAEAALAVLSAPACDSVISRGEDAISTSARLHVSAALPLLEQIVGRRAGTVPLQLEGDAQGAGLVRRSRGRGPQ